MPAPIGTVQLGQQVEQWYGQKIVAQFGGIAQTAVQDPTRSVKSSKTATQVNTEASTGSILRDSFVEKLSIRSLEPLFQDVYDALRQYNTDPSMTFERTVDGNSMIGLVAREELDIDRRVVATGYQGLQNRARAIEELQTIIQILTTGNAMEVNPNYLAVLDETLFRLLGYLGVRDIQKYKQDSLLLIAGHPQVQQQIMQMSLQFAEMIAQGMPPEQILMMLQQMGAGGQPQGGQQGIPQGGQQTRITGQPDFGGGEGNSMPVDSL